HDLGPAQRDRVEVITDAEGLVRGDPTLLTALVRNAVDNALKHADTPVRVHVADAPQRVTMSITDRGPGIDRDLVERVFEPFFRAHPDKSLGYGLGLALVGHVARAHGGNAAFADTTTGTELTVSFPSWASALDTAEPPAT
ncbi:MAG TPA: ATP-binding protein, partial [Polyangiaceae bacterium]